MMRVVFIGLVASMFLAASASASPTVGQLARVFSAVDSNGATRSLAQFKGKTVVLEWTNNGCPYTRKHYESGNMQRLQQEATASGVVWLSVISSAPGKEGYVTGSEANDLTASRFAHPSAVLLDPTGVVGRAYEAQTTPHMFVIDKAGVLRYMGAIDDHPVASPASLAGARNYVREALGALAAGKPVAVASTEPYGCSVKY